MNLLRTLAIIAIIYLAIRFIGRYILPLLVKTAANKAQEDMMNKMDEILKRQQEQKKEDDITIKNKSTNDKARRKGDDGEYVDYEEVK